MSDSQKFISTNRAPRVQIEYDVELFGSEKTVQLPFVMGVMSDLSGKSRVEPPAVADRKFLEIDADNFDDRMKAMAPRVAFSVPNTLTGDGNLSVDLTFERMSDFEPGAIAAKIEPLRALLDARQQLTDLMAYMDGKTGAEQLIEKILAEPALLQALSAGAAPDTDMADVLDGLRVQTPDEAPQVDEAADVLSSLAAQAPVVTDQPDAGQAVLSDLAARTPDADQSQDDTADVLSGLAAMKPEPQDDPSATQSVLQDLAATAPTDSSVDDGAGDILAGLAAALPDPAPTKDTTPDVLAGLAQSAPDEPEPDASADILSDLSALGSEETTTRDDTADILAGLEAPASEDVGDGLDDVLAELADLDQPETPDTDNMSILSDLVTDQPEPAPEPDGTTAALDTLAAALPQPPVEDETVDDILGALDAPTAPEAEPDPLEDILASVDLPAPADTDPDPMDDILSDLGATATPETTTATSQDADLSDILGDLTPPPASTDDTDLDDILGGLDPVQEVSAEQATDDLAAVLGDLTVPDEADPTAEIDPLDDILGALDPVEEAGAPDDLDDIIGGIAAPETAPESDPLDDILGGLEVADVTPAVSPEPDPLDDILSGVAPASDTTADQTSEEDLDDILGALSAAEPEDQSAPDFDPLDDLLADASPEPAQVEPAAPDVDDLGLDDLLGDLDAASDTAQAVDLDEDPLGLDDLLGDLGTPPQETTPAETIPETAPAMAPEPAQATLTEPEFAFGTLSGEALGPEKLVRKRFRIALFGDFTGRAARGALETGDALANRTPVQLDPDTIEDILEGFASDLVLPVGRDGAGVSVPISGLDDLHPDELYENVALFSELNGLRGQLTAGATSANAMARLTAWAEAHDMPLAPTHTRSAASSVPADRKLSDFQQLIGDHGGRLTQASPVEDMIARIIGPHVRQAPDMDAVKLVDAATSSAMRLILHHPDFQALESQWRSLDLLARSIEADDQLDVVLYDVSAEEIAADLAASDDLANSGLARLLTGAPLDPDTGRGAFSAMMGLYAFEETPPHAQILGRVARVAAHVDAPFVTSISPAFLETPKEDRHPLVADAWDTLRAMPEAAYLGLAAPRFMLRRPYGAKTDPIMEFDFEEFTMAQGLKGMLWANPVVLITILMAQSYRKNGAALDLGSVMSLGDVPYHFVTDRYGDQVQLPCTERNLTLARVEDVMARGIMPVVSIKGRDEIRLASFQSLGGGTLRGPWSDLPQVEKSPPKPPSPIKDDATVTQATDIMEDLDDLLAGFGDDPDAPAQAASDGAGDIDADLAALLEDL